ncbi:MAG: PAS domain S-box protein, partial [Anaerolineae bacterium]|nr:PAS domain S-box protein [Anaerolineae bacterium]
MERDRLTNGSSYKIVVLGVLLALCALVMYYFHFVLAAEIVFTHLFYVPIILAGLWWSRKGTLVAVFLAMLLLISHIFSPLETSTGADIARATMFVVVGATVCTLNEKRLILEAKLRAYSKTLEQRVEERTRALREAQEKQRAILDGIGDAVIVLDQNLNVTWANPIAVEQCGFVLGHKCYEACKWQKQPCVDCVVQKTFADGVSRTSENECTLRDGSRINFVANCSPVRDSEGRLVAVVEIFHDITARVQAETARRESEERYRTMIENANDLIWVLDTQGNFTVSNQQVEIVSGHKSEDLKGKSFVPLIHPDDLEMVNEVLRKTLSGIRQQYRTKVYKRNGEILILSVNTAPIYKLGKIDGTVSFGRDITTRRQAQEALQESEEQLQTLIDAMPDFVCFKDGDGHWLKINAASIRLFRLAGVDYRGKKDSELAELNGGLQGTFLTCARTDAETWRTRRLSRGEELISQPDGTVRIYDVIKMPVFHPDGERKGLVVLGHDVTEQVQAEEERARLLAQIRAQAKQIQQTIDTVPEGVLVLDRAQRVILANPVAEGYLAVLANAQVGDTLTRLGNHPLAELLISPPDKELRHEVQADGRTFEVIARPMEPVVNLSNHLPNENVPEPENWVLVIRDVTQEREIQQLIQHQERL